MKNTFLAILAVIATASITQAANNQPGVLPVFTVNGKALEFIDLRLEAVVHEQVALTLKEAIPATVIAEAKAMTRPGIRFALAKDASDIVLLASNNS